MIGDHDLEETRFWIEDEGILRKILESARAAEKVGMESGGCGQIIL